MFLNRTLESPICLTSLYTSYCFSACPGFYFIEPLYLTLDLFHLLYHLWFYGMGRPAPFSRIPPGGILLLYPPQFSLSTTLGKREVRTQDQPFLLSCQVYLCQARVCLTELSTRASHCFLCCQVYKAGGGMFLWAETNPSRPTNAQREWLHINESSRSAECSPPRGIYHPRPCLGWKTHKNRACPN